jgi:hypothetical protein
MSAFAYMSTARPNAQEFVVFRLQFYVVLTIVSFIPIARRIGTHFFFLFSWLLFLYLDEK